MNSLIYAIVVNNNLYSNRMEIKLPTIVTNGIYSLNMDDDNFLSTLCPANIEDARKFFSKSSKISVIRGVSFHDGIIPVNPVIYKKIPIKVIDSVYDEFEEIEVVNIKDQIYYFIQVIQSDKAYILMDIKEAFEAKKTIDINKMSGISPEIRILHVFHTIERVKKEMTEPVNFIKNLMSETGANVKSIVKKNIGYEVVWSFDGHTINTLLNKTFGILEAGFCLSGGDKKHSARSIVNLLKGYIENGDHINLTRTVR